MLGTLLVLFSFSVMAFDNPLVGMFSYQGQPRVHMATRYEVIARQSSDAKEKIKTLIADGYHCETLGQFERCRKTISQDHPVVVSTLQKWQPRFENIQFGEPTGVALINDADALKQYQVTQELWIDGNKFSEQTLYNVMIDIEKVTSGDPQKSDYLSLVRQGENFYHLQEKSITESRWVFYRLWIINPFYLSL